MAGNKRIMKELADITTSPPEGCTVKLPEEWNIYTWDVTMEGPPTSLYAGGKFHIQITLPKEYPFKPPTLSFKTKIYHPNVSNDDRGAICLGMLKSDEWKPPNKIAEVLRLVWVVLDEPQPDDAVEAGIADQYKSDRNAFEKVAKEWTNKYAK